MLFEQEQSPVGPLAAAWEFLETRKALTERVVDIVPINWYLAESNFSAQYTRRKDYEDFDEVICGLLLAAPNSDSAALRGALGLDAELGDKVLTAMIKPLLGTMIGGDTSCWYLTTRGETYAREGRKFVRNDCNFALITDLQDVQEREAHQVKGVLGVWKEVGDEVKNAEDIIESVRAGWSKEGKVTDWAGIQVPSFHHPEKGLFLESPEGKKIRLLSTAVWVGVLEDFHTQTLHFHAFHPADAKELPGISKILNAPSGEKTRERVAAAIRKQNAARIIAEAVPAAQLQEEGWVVEQVKALAPLEDAERKLASKALVEERKSFDTLEFEQELERLSQEGGGEWWLISPWIRSAAWNKRRKQLERSLGRGSAVFIGYSQPHNPGEEMVPPEVLREIVTMQAKHPKLFVAQLPQFHEKIMYAEVKGQRYEYTGSFNLLSFAAGKQERLGRENMRRLRWGEDSEANRQGHLAGFQAYYAAKWGEALEPLGKVDVSERKSLLEAGRRVAEISAAYGGFASHVGGEECASFLARCDMEKERFAKALHAWHRKQLEAEIEGLKALEDLPAGSASGRLHSAKDRLKTDKVPESAFQEELQALSRALDGLAFKAEVKHWEQELHSNPVTISESEVRRLQQKLGQIGARFPKADGQLVAEALRAAEAKLKARMPEVGLKVVGKIELPPPSKKDQQKKKR